MENIMDDFQHFCVCDSALISKTHNELSRLKSGSSVCYLDNAGASLYSEAQIQGYSRLLCENVYGNPHSGNQSSTLSADMVEQVRQRVVRFFSTSIDEYSVIFTSGCTASLKLLSETFRFHGNICEQCEEKLQIVENSIDSNLTSLSQQNSSSGAGIQSEVRNMSQNRDNVDSGVFCYLEDNHTSVIGMREVVKYRGHRFHCILQADIDEAFDQPISSTFTSLKCDNGEKADISNNTMEHKTGKGCCCLGNHLFVYPAQSNFNGRKYPLCWIDKIQRHGLQSCDRSAGGCVFCQRIRCECTVEGHGHRKWFVGLDAASFVSTSPLDLSSVKPDFVTLSFYKIFGFPTGLGALLVRNVSAHVLEKCYFGGGTIDVSISKEDFHVPRQNISERFEDGTISFLDIIALNSGFDSLQRIAGSMSDISHHTFELARFVYRELHSMQHQNMAPVVKLYHQQHGHFNDITQQGPIICFNILRSDGSHVGFSQVDKLAQTEEIHLRTGCFCNMGACQYYLNLSTDRIKLNHQTGHVCGDDLDLIEGQPTGATRISFGYFSTLEDALTFLNFIHSCFVEGGPDVNYLKHGRDILRKHFEIATDCSKQSERRHPNDESNERIICKTINNGNKYSTNDMPGETCHNITGVEKFVKTASDSEETKANGEVDKRGISIGGNVASNGYNHDKVLTNIFLYPVKSCRALEVSEWELGLRGLLYDREWMVTTETGVCLSQKREPRLCLIQPHIDRHNRKLYLKADGHDAVEVNLDMDSGDDVQGKLCHSKVCGDRIEGSECGAEVSHWLQTVIGRPGLRLVRQKDTDNRTSRLTKQDSGAGRSLSLANEAQYLLINTTSCLDAMATLTKTESTEETVSRFRANLVVRTESAFEEDHWKEVVIGSHRFQKQRQCTRCQMISIHQKTGERSKEPLLQLAKHQHRKMTFGILLYWEDLDSNMNGVLRVGDRVEVVAEEETNTG